MTAVNIGQEQNIDHTITDADYDQAVKLLALADHYMSEGQEGDAHHALITAMHLLGIEELHA